MFDVAIDDIEPGQITRYCMLSDGSPVTYATVLNLWQSNSSFRRFFITLLADSPFSAYRWETPPITQSTAGRPFEFVLINSPGFCARQADVKTYAQYFTADDIDSGIVVFANLGGDAKLIVPSPRTSDTTYGHLAAFVRGAPQSQADALWRVLGTQVQSQLGRSPIWINTAGGDVAWLHVRIDSWPKYYGHMPYKNASR